MILENSTPLVVLTMATQTGNLPKEEIADFTDEVDDLGEECHQDEELLCMSYNECVIARREFMAEALPMFLDEFVDPGDTKWNAWMTIQIEELYNEMYDRIIGFG